MERNGILIFHSVHRVMKAEKVLKTAGLDVRLMPVPRQLSSDCGLSISFFLKDRERAILLMEAEGCACQEIHVLEGEVYRRIA